MTRTNAAVRAALASLGLPTDATRIEITQAYRRLARATHPDLCLDVDAAEQFAATSAAYQQAIAAAPDEPIAPPARDCSPSPGRSRLVAPRSVPRAGVVAGPVHVSPLSPTPSPPNRRHRP